MMIGMPEKRVVVLQLCAEVDDGGAMQLRLLLSTLAVAFIVMPFTAAAAAASLPDLRGIAPKDVKYYESSTIWCRDNSKTFVKERLNDNFCDCADGTDEPGTPACPDSRFYCMNTGSKKEIVFSSRVNDGICDCCDGSDEYDGSVICLNTCEDGISMEQERKLEVSVEERPLKHFELVRGKHNEDDLLKQDKRSTDFFDSIEVRDVKLVLFLEVAVLAAFLCCHGCKWQRVKHSLKKGLLKPSSSY